MQNIESVIEEIRQGNESLREELIASNKTFIYRYTSFICKRKLDWANDDELSIALIALNNAIDKYTVHRRGSFSAYARVLIRNSLIDYFRKQPDSPSVPLETPGMDGTPTTKEAAISLEYYTKELENRDRAYELQLFKEELTAFGLTLAKLPTLSPSHKGTREYLKSAAQKIACNEELIKKIYRDKRLPLKEIQALTGVTRKSLEKWRKYLLALIIILTNPELGIMAEYIRGRED